MPFMVSALDIGRTLQRTNLRTTAGPDNIPGQTQREFAQKLTMVLTDIF